MAIFKIINLKNVLIKMNYLFTKIRDLVKYLFFFLSFKSWFEELWIAITIFISLWFGKKPIFLKNWKIGNIQEYNLFIYYAYLLHISFYRSILIFPVNLLHKGFYLQNFFLPCWERRNLGAQEGGKLACRSSFIKSERFLLTFD